LAEKKKVKKTTTRRKTTPKPKKTKKGAPEEPSITIGQDLYLKAKNKAIGLKNKKPRLVLGLFLITGLFLFSFTEAGRIFFEVLLGRFGTFALFLVVFVKILPQSYTPKGILWLIPLLICTGYFVESDSSLTVFDKVHYYNVNSGFFAEMLERFVSGSIGEIFFAPLVILILLLSVVLLIVNLFEFLGQKMPYAEINEHKLKTGGFSLIKKLTDESTLKGNNKKTDEYEQEKVLVADGSNSTESEELKIEIDRLFTPKESMVSNITEDDPDRQKLDIADGITENVHIPEEFSNKEVVVADIDKLDVNSEPEKTEWVSPDYHFLKNYDPTADGGDVIGNKDKILRTLKTFNIESEIDPGNILVGPNVTQYALSPKSDVKLSRITALSQNLSLELAAKSLRIEAPIPGKRLVGIEIPNVKSETVGLKSIIDEIDNFRSRDSEVLFPIGKAVTGRAIIADLTKAPHMLIAGATGTGKSVCLNTLLCSMVLQHTPDTLRMILVDPKRVEFTPYQDIPHLLSPVITNPMKVINALKWLVKEMDDRYKRLASMGVRKISDYNEKAPVADLPEMPFIVLIVDELSDLMMVAGKEVESYIVRLTQMARAVGIHVVLATQRPSVNVITGLIKANIPARISFAVTSQIDSRTILDSSGAEKLLGKGDGLFFSPDTGRLVRFQGAFLSEDEIEKITEQWKAQGLPVTEDLDPEYHISSNNLFSQQTPDGDLSFTGYDPVGEEEKDDMYLKAKNTALESGSVSTSLLQRKLRIGYGRAARIIDQMEDEGLIGPNEGTNKPRKVISQ
jgi:DNA segregation ATPase FtsK/SpoIIIE-like protein